MVLTSKPVVVSNEPVEIFKISSGRYLAITNSVTVSTESSSVTNWTVDVSIGERSVVTSEFTKVDSVFVDTE